MKVPSKYTQEFSFTPVFINSQTCLFFILPFFGVITKWKDVGEVIMTGVNLNCFVHFDGSFILCCKRDVVNSKLYEGCVKLNIYKFLLIEFFLFFFFFSDYCWK